MLVPIKSSHITAAVLLQKVSLSSLILQEAATHESNVHVRLLEQQLAAVSASIDERTRELARAHDSAALVQEQRAHEVVERERVSAFSVHLNIGSV